MCTNLGIDGLVDPEDPDVAHTLGHTNQIEFVDPQVCCDKKLLEECEQDNSQVNVGANHADPQGELLLFAPAFADMPQTGSGAHKAVSLLQAQGLYLEMLETRALVGFYLDSWWMIKVRK